MRPILLAALAGCEGDGLRVPTTLEPAPPTRSGAMVAFGPDLVAVNAWDGTVSRVSPDAQAHQALVVGGEPTRVAVVGHELWVTLRAERAIAVLEAAGDALVEVERFVVGAEPYGIVADPEDRFVYVALSQEDAVVEIDAASRELGRRWPVDDDPRWLAAHPSGGALYVTHAFDSTLTVIDLTEGDAQTFPAPEIRVDGRDLASRATAEVAVSPEGDTIVVPTLYVDNLQPGPQPTFEDGVVLAPPVPYYVPEKVSSAPIGRFNPTLVVYELSDPDGLQPRVGMAEAVFVPGVDLSGSVRGYVASATFGPGGLVVNALEGDDAVVVVDLEDDRPGPGAEFSDRDKRFFEVAENPYAVVNAEDGAVWVHERGTRSVARLPVEDATSRRGSNPQTFHADERFSAGASLLPPEIEAGRHLFYSATDPIVSTPGAGVSCNTCHVDGRNDGWTWEFDSNPRQTPSLAGPVSQTAPVTWTDAVPTVAEEAVFTAIGRMGGRGIDLDEAELVAAFVDWTRDVDVPTRGSSDPLVSRGAELFGDPRVACATCHSGPRYTDNAMHDLHGMVLNTPSLVGISATRPYFYDGSAPTLRDVLEASADGSMGSTGHLLPEELDALEAFLLSL